MGGGSGPKKAKRKRKAAKTKTGKMTRALGIKRAKRAKKR